MSLDLNIKLDYSHSEDNKYYWVLSEVDQISDAVIKGKDIYNKACVMCHEIGGASSVSSSDPKTIRAAMLTDTGGMGELNYLTDPELENVAEYIKKLIGSIPPTTVEIGQSLYDKKCLACHVFGTPPSKSSVNPDTIRAAILTDAGGMSKLKNLSNTDLEAIANYIESSSSIFDILFNPPTSTPPPTPTTAAARGKNIYDNNCLKCHALGTSASNKSSDPSKISNAISKNLGGKASLNLTASNIDDIAAYIQNN